MYGYRLKLYFIVFCLVLTTNLGLSQHTERKAEQSKPSAESLKAGAFIDVNVPPYPASSYTITQLITDVLIAGGGGCTTPQISNVVVSPNLPHTAANRTWGYFNKGTTNFPFDDGVVLVTGPAIEAGNAYISGTLNGGEITPPDPDLISAINPLGTLNNTTFIEFDFVPGSNVVKFNYLFASEEYTSSFPCGNYSDGFALLIRPNTTPVSAYTNLAVLPAGAGPVSVTNIVPANFSCGPINANYFAGLNNTNIETNFNGRTIPLEASTTVIPGQSYHFKMVIADAVDGSFNSGVFLEGGSFNIGVQILGPSGEVLPSNVYICDNTPQTLTASVQIPGATYQWFLGTTPIVGATNTTYVTNQPGEYSVEVTIPGNSCPRKATITIINAYTPTVNNITYTQCYAPGDVLYNLPLTQLAVSTTPGVTYTYYENLVDAQAQNNNFIANPAAYSSPGNQTIYVVVKSEHCSNIAEIQLVKAPEMKVEIATPPAINCLVPTVNLNANASVFPAGSSIHWVASNGGYILSNPNSLTPTVAAGGTYTLTISKAYQPGDILCTAVGSVVVAEDITPPVTSVTASDFYICPGDSVNLFASGGLTYSWSHSASTASTITVNPMVTTTYTVYAIGANGCKSLEPKSITIEVEPVIYSTLPPISGQICNGDSITLDAGLGSGNYTYSWYKIISPNDNDFIGNGQTISVDEIGDYFVIIKSGDCEKRFDTKVVLAESPYITEVKYENLKLEINAYNPSIISDLEYSIDNGVNWQNSNVFENVPSNMIVSLLVRIKDTSCVGNFQYFTLNIPNFISPNDDGKNETLDFTAISRYEDFTAEIYDRYGKRIWQAKKDAPVWDGKYLGRRIPSATYWYKISYKDPINKSMIKKDGWIVIKN